MNLNALVNMHDCVEGTAALYCQLLVVGEELDGQRKHVGRGLGRARQQQRARELAGFRARGRQGTCTRKRMTLACRDRRRRRDNKKAAAAVCVSMSNRGSIDGDRNRSRPPRATAGCTGHRRVTTGKNTRHCRFGARNREHSLRIAEVGLLTLHSTQFPMQLLRKKQRMLVVSQIWRLHFLCSYVIRFENLARLLGLNSIRIER